MRPELRTDFAEQTLRIAAERAVLLGHEVIAVLPLTTPYIDPVQWLRLELARGETGFYLGSPRRGEEIAGAGLAALVDAGSDNRFGTARGEMRKIFADAVFALPFLRRVARAFCVFAFSDEDSRGPWAGMPQNLCVLPERIIVRRRGTVFGAQLVRVSPEGHIEAPAQPADITREKFNAGGWTHGQWHARSSDAISRIRSGELEKVVLVRREARALPEVVDSLGLVEELRERYATCTTYWVSLPGGRTFVGATPEQLVKVAGRRVSTMALAGTMPAGPDTNWGPESEALLASGKNRHEQGLVVREIMETLQGLCSHVRVPDEPRVLRLGNVCHLLSTITGRLAAQHHILDLVEALHPTPAVGGLPRLDARELIAELEPEGRGWYAGPIGWCDASGEGEFFVALRAALLTPGMAHLFAGCGLVAASDPEDEWQETGWKMKAVGEALGAAG